MKQSNPIPELSEDDITRFWAKVIITTPNKCWNWRGAIKGRGYSRFALNSRGYSSHRVAWFLYNRKQPGNSLVCHHCDNPRCCNPYHLFLGTISDNAVDKNQKGRGVDNRGAKHGLAKLSMADVSTIRQLSDLGYSQSKIAEQFKIHQGTVSRLVNRHRWRHF